MSSLVLKPRSVLALWMGNEQVSAELVSPNIIPAAVKPKSRHRMWAIVIGFHDSSGPGLSNTTIEVHRARRVKEYASSYGSHGDLCRQE